MTVRLRKLSEYVVQDPLAHASRIRIIATSNIGTALHESEGRPFRYRAERVALEAATAWQFLQDNIPSGRQPGHHWQESRALVAAIYRAAVGTLEAPDKMKAYGMAPSDLLHTVGCLMNTLHKVDDHWGANDFDGDLWELVGEDDAGAVEVNHA